MKKSLFFVAAASALMLTACSSESDVVQNASQPQTTLQNNAVGFDVYTPAPTNVTRSGQAGTMTTSRLQRDPGKGGGFGVYAYLVEDVYTDPGDGSSEASSYRKYGTGPKDARDEPFAPNFMVNEWITWNNTNMGWEYAPIKYWPNETDNDSQNTKAQMEGFTGDKHLDRLTFFAYAPYVSGTNSEIGVTKVTDNAGKLGGEGSVIEASVEYKASLLDPNASVDLLWGVAPSGGLSYTAVNGRTVNVPEGQPLMDMTKPGVNTSMKFLFNHALARIGINVVAAVDQLGAGGNLNNEQTRITIANVTLTGKFGETGVLNLDNPTPNIAHWVNINGTDITATAPTAEKTLEIPLAKIAPSLRFVGSHASPEKQTVTGVTTTKQDLLAGRYYALDETPAYSPARMYYKSNGTELHAEYDATTTDKYYEKDGNDYKVKTGTIYSPNNPDDLSGYYSIEEGATHYEGNNPKEYYTQAECDLYNATLPGHVTTADHNPATETNYTEETAAAKNATLDGAINTTTVLTADQAAALNALTGGSYVAGNSPTAADAKLYNATLSGAVTTEQKDPTTGSNYTAEAANAYNYNLPSARKTTDVKSYGYAEITLPASTSLYTKSGDNYIYAGQAGSSTLWGAEKSGVTYYTIATSAIPATSIDYTYKETVYDVERNYFMVVPTANVKTFHPSLDKEVEEGLRTIRVKIEYYITTEDDKLAGGRVQTKNVIEKDVVFPSLANGKSYMLNLVLGLTSVKMDAEVDEWRVTNVNGDLPQNTDN